jgi:hypothetical protein
MPSDGEAADSGSDKAAPAPPVDDSELEAAIAAIRGNKDLPRPPYPTLPNLSAPTPVPAKVQAVQSYIEKLSYNFTGVNYFDVRKQRPLGRILETAREITRQALPIKCVEAIFVAAYLTQGLKELERIPVSFKSSVDGQSYKHIILALKYNSKWGSVGLSRRRELYFKEMQFDSLGDLFLEFKRSYERVFHTLKRVKVGLPISHDMFAGEYVCWNYLTVKCADVNNATTQLAEHGRCAHRLQEQWRNECKKMGCQPGQKPVMPQKKAATVSGAGSKKRTISAEGVVEGSDGSSSDAEPKRQEEEAAAPAADGEQASSAAEVPALAAAAPPADKGARPSFLAV